MLYYNHMKRTLGIIAALAVIAALTWSITIAVNNSNGNFFGFLSPVDGDMSCVAEQRTVQVDGTSMEPVLAANSEVTLLEGYYDCNDINRGELVAYRFSANRSPIVKVIIGMPGDAVSVEEAEGGFALYVNGEEVVNAQGDAYRFNEGRANMIRLYTDSYTEGVPADTYFILGNVPSGSFDSSQFGFVHRSDFLGRIVE